MTEDDIRPDSGTAEIDWKTIRGFYGQFQSDTSYPLSFVQTSIPVSDIEILKTATEAFSVADMGFDELIQRDIDQERVQEIVDNYLKNGKDRPLFFPPLLASLVAIEEAALVPQYESIEHKREDKVLTATWGGDRFQLVLPHKGSSSTNHEYAFDGHSINAQPYWAQIKLNPKKAALVVIDGQHRLSALKWLALSHEQENKKVVTRIDVPVCILFSPEATVDNPRGEKVTHDMRELFVRINSTAKEVSGHFTTLLNDRSLSALAIRAFCDASKTTPLNEGGDRLNLIEWNERINRYASQVTRKYSITTIKIIADVLSQHAFKDPGATQKLLNLSARQSELEANESFSKVSEIFEDSFSPGQSSQLLEVMKSIVAPSLSVLFFSGLPFVDKVKAFEKAMSALNQKIRDGKTGASTFKNDILGQYRKETMRDTNSARDMADEFNELIENESNDQFEVFRTNVFQQGMLRAWIALSGKLVRYNISPVATSQALVEALNVICFDTQRRIFDSERIYTQKLLFNGARILVQNRAKDCWEFLILATLGSTESKKAFANSIGDMRDEQDNKVDVETLVEDIAKDAFKRYCLNLEKVIQRDFRSYWADKPWEPRESERLEEISELLRQEENEQLAAEFEKIILEGAERRFKEAKAKLQAVLTT